MLSVSETWRTRYPGAVVGLLAMAEVVNPEHHDGLEESKLALEAELRQRYAGYDRQALRALPIMQAYTDYYKRFRKTYHVQLQIESVALRGQSIPSVAALVETMFMAELKTSLLTAVHDLDAVRPPLRLDIAQGAERFVRLDGQEQELKPEDMYIADAEGILSTIIYGPDQRTRITPATRRALYTTYAPPGIGAETLRAGLDVIQRYVLVVAPEARVEALEIHVAE
jgi:DNA/RNA-binding domain of Phe-tRNA-synthetase-like protein